MVSLNRRFNPAIMEAKRWLAEEAPGPPRAGLGRMIRFHRREEGFPTGTGIHLVDALPDLPEAGGLAGTHSGEQVRAWSGALTCAGGAQVAFHLSPDAGLDQETYEISGPGYTIMVETEVTILEIWTERAQNSRRRLPADAAPEVRFGAYHETRAFLDAVAAGSGFAPTLEDALISMRTAEWLATQPAR